MVLVLLRRRFPRIDITPTPKVIAAEIRQMLRL